MTSFPRSRSMLLTVCALSLSAGVAFAQHHDVPQPDPHQPPSAAPHHEMQPAHHTPAGTAEARIGDAYPFETCPITGKKLGSMGDPVTKLYEGREVRFCCPMCPPKFEKDVGAGMKVLDEKIVKDQTPLYPLKTSLVTGKDLPEKPVDFVYGNRLVRLGAESEKADFVKDAAKFMQVLDKAVVEKQGKDYPLTKCPVSGEAYGGDMGETVDKVVAGRLIRLCCSSCPKAVEKNPAKFIAMVDAAQKAAKDKANPAPKEAAPHAVPGPK